MEARVRENDAFEEIHEEYEAAPNAVLDLKSSTEYLTFSKEIDINPFQKFIINRIILCVEVTEPSKTRRIALSGFSACAITFGSFAGLPFVDAILATNTIPVLPNILAAATVVSFGSGAIWGWLKMLDEFRTKSDEENQLLHHTGKYQTIIITASSILLGTLSAIPSVYIAYKYNKGLFWPLYNLLTSTGLHTYGYSRAIKSNIIRGKIWHRLFSPCSDYHRKLYAKLADEQNKRLMLENIFRVGFSIRGIPKQNLSPKAAIRYSELLMHDVIRIGIWHINKQAANKKFNRSKLIASFSSLFFPVCFATITSILSYKGVNLFSNSVLICLLFSVLSIIPALAIELIGNSSVFSQSHEKLFGYTSLPHTAVTREHKIPSTIITTFLVLMGSISVLNGAVIANAEIDNFFNILTIPLLVFSTVGELITKGFMATDLSFSGFEKGVVSFNKDKIKTEILKEQQVEQLLNLIQNGNEDEFQGFLQLLFDNPELTTYMESKKQETVSSCTSTLFNKEKISYKHLTTDNKTQLSSVMKSSTI